MNIFDKGMELKLKVLDLRAAQHRLIQSNIANEETPGFRALELRFSDALAAASGSQTVTAQATHARHIPVPDATVQSFVRPVAANDLPLDANSVNLELEMAKLSDNSRNYNAAAELMRIELRELLEAVRGGQ